MRLPGATDSLREDAVEEVHLVVRQDPCAVHDEARTEEAVDGLRVIDDAAAERAAVERALTFARNHAKRIGVVALQEATHFAEAKRPERALFCHCDW
jgi:hypothetical protein